MAGASKAKSKPAPSSGRIPMTKSGFCQWPGRDSVGHAYCTTKCDCECHSNN